MTIHGRASVGGGDRPLHAILLPLGAAFFIATLVTDWLYVVTLSQQWETFSIWLLTAGLVIAAVSGLCLLVDLLGPRHAFRLDGLAMTAAVLAALLSLLNAFIHSRDNYTAVVPSGITLSAIVTLILVFLGARRWSVTLPRTAPEPSRSPLH